ncbi:Zn(II)2Cys6 transcription factor domain-containing protein [Aspergillus saccharolyticus JOP 1030-1]|uniref:Zn(2)-C6 fungal-type domain-containing protein n=1 Tax=Aspergillus saccharolyticus JOP 1030-1 TaxID=1450539 RepID=A0A318ZMX9_9EURO|nr:hypothetical protein BP01DRAFT_334498 [Aspergillus saccharolyticus JOP 1030-1]PYH48035.1 hypothetical protein BP01DRAFT_334498 [Aspergillus saccharolyticus JOP 1030-1]
MPQPRPRVSRNCGNCRAIKRRCDQQRPQCGQCTRLGEQCRGYRDPWELVFRDQTNRTIQRSRIHATRPQSPSAAAPTEMVHSPLPPPNPCPNMDQIGVNYFLHHFVTDDHSPSRGYLKYIPATLGANDDHPSLVASLAAVGLGALANSGHQPELARQARLKYAEAIRSVNAALASPVESVKDSTLMAVISLGVFEHFSQFDSWVRHVEGAAALAVLRGRDQFARSPLAILLFTQVRTDMIIACTRLSRPFPDDLRKLQEEATKHVDPANAIWHIGILATWCVDLLARVMKNPDPALWPEILAAALALRQDFQRGMDMLAVQEPYFTATTNELMMAGLLAERHSRLIYADRTDLYPSVWSIRAWNNARCIQIILCEVICYLLKSLLAREVAAPAACVQLRQQQLYETREILSRLSEDVLATVPQAMGIVSSPSSPFEFSANNPSPGTSVSGAYMLIWCLYMAGISEATAGRARKWIIQRFQEIVQVSGIELASPLLAEVMKKDQTSR